MLFAIKLHVNLWMTAWSADSKYVYFDTGYSTEAAFYRVRISDHAVERLASFKDVRRLVAPDITMERPNA
jgi:hypothetical protein